MKGSGVATAVAIGVFLAVVGIAIVGGIFDGFSIWYAGIIGLALLGVLVALGAWILAIARR